MKSIIEKGVIALIIASGSLDPLFADEGSVLQEQQMVALNASEAFDGNPERTTHGARWYTTHAAALHRIADIHLQSNETLLLGDGSIWSIYSRDRHTLEEWWGDTVTIMIHSSVFGTDYAFKIVNERTGESVRANILYGSTRDKARLITRIDYQDRQLFVSDGSVWDVSDSKAINEWSEGDCVMFGVNDGLFSRYANIMINVKDGSYVSARCHF